MSDVLLATTGVAKRFGPVVALRAADLAVHRGEVHALLGANGAGKSTLVKILSGVYPADAGTVMLDGAELDVRRPADAAAAGIATVFQDPALVPDLTIDENLRLTRTERRAVAPWIERFGLGGVALDARSRDLPLEMLRLFDLARVLAQDPKVLLLDEITAALPADQVEIVVGVMEEWAARDRAVVFITHRLAEVRTMCDRATVLRDGRAVAVLDPRAVTEQRLVETMLGETAQETAARVATVRRTEGLGPVVLEAQDLRSRAKVNGVSLAVRAGEVLGIVALEGQGQERLFELLSGDRRPDEGELIVEGQPLRARSPFDAIERGVVLVPSDRLHALLPQRSVHENLVTPLYNRARRWFRLQPDERARAQRSIERLSIDTRAQAEVRRLSGGNQQKVVLGRWLASGFRTLLCFDPTRGIDLHTKRQIYDLLRELADDGAAIVLYTSELQEVALICDRVLVLYGGRVVSEVAGDAADEETLLSAAHGLMEATP